MRFILKVNASKCPGAIGRPDNAADWEGKVFKAETERGFARHSEHPDPDDHLMIWINDGVKGVGAGLTAIGEVSSFDPNTHEIVTKNVQLFPAPRLNRTELMNPDDHRALAGLAGSRIVPLRSITPEDWDAIRESATKKVANAAASAHSNMTASEGKRRYSGSVTLERDPQISKEVKERNKRLHGGSYKCEACTFSEANSSLFDAHHLVPLCLGERQTSVLNFAVLCPTCHRLAHRLRALHDPLRVEEIKNWWRERT
jgi:hypothetical protein